MKRLITFLTLAALLTTGVFNQVYAQGQGTEQTVQTETTQVAAESRGFHQAIKDYFIQGGAGFMASILMCLIFGLAIAIERTLYLNLSATNTKKLLNRIETALESKGIGEAKEICANTRGPVASIFFQGLTRYNEGLEMVEKSIVSYGGVLMGRLENGMTWISLFIATAPMLGFLGTVIGMVQAFDAIEAAGDISPTIVAGGIKVALLTTVFGLITAIILQFFYNYLVSRIDNIVNDMEDSTISFIDLLSKYKK